MFLSYDYEDLIYELLRDCLEFNKTEDDFLYIERDWDREPYHPIIDYSFDPLDVPHEKVLIKYVLEEMREMNKLIR